MARIESLNILLESTGKEYLAELYGKVIENVNKQLVSARMKNTDLSGNPEAGSVEAKRFVNAASKDYGTARAAGKGDAVKAKPVTIPIDQDKEIVEELEQKDVSLYGVDGILAKRANNHVQRMAAELDTAFFAEAKKAGTKITPVSTDVPDEIEEAIQVCENTKNDFVDGVPRSMINLVCSTAYYGKIRTYLDKVSRANVDSSSEEFYEYHGVKTFSSVHLPDGVDYEIMVDGAIAQPVMSDQYTAEKIPLSNAYGVELFYHCGTKAVMPDLIFYKESAAASNS
ncbi:MAG: hypothetical protein J6B43_11175 [Lachnospiraceae bacterium]|nr:hypothetical protein [Lachnospiraceae bacterium]